ncbi:MAG: hypothetical protein HC896_14250 [Bacteroidales bacterium]|nr:hypothetical protein [Bacteroidales bacterium]
MPNTDVSRLKALKTAYRKAKELPPFNLAFSQSAFQLVQSFLPGFEKSILNYKHGYKNQVEKNKDYIKEMSRAKLYISHFIQVLNMAIVRGELSADNRAFFNMDVKEKKLPTLNTEADIIKWGERLIQGERNRKIKGLTPISNPTIAVVQVRYEKFMDAFQFQKTIQKTNAMHLNKLASLRREADNIIQKVWNEVEDAYMNLPEEEKERMPPGMVFNMFLEKRD